MFRPAGGRASRLEHGRAVPGVVLDARGEPLDRGYLTLFDGPRSYTGEDTAEISTHGSPFLLGALLDALRARGARAAEPGEFTYRAFRNGKLDLAQAEAVADLVAAQTAHQARLAFRQLEGGMARRLAPVREALAGLMAHLEASLEFPEEEGTLLAPQEIGPRLDAIETPLHELLATYEGGRRLRRGATVVLSGAPNVGKSSLFNRLLGAPRAIVTTVPGTTRDAVSESVEIGGVPVRLVDTAGLGPATDPIVVEGVRRAQAERGDADLVLFVLDRSRPPSDEERAELEAAPPDTLVALNKCDLPAAEAAAPGPGRRVVEVSALTGEGVPRLEAALTELLAPGGDSGEVLLTRRRQRDELAACLACVERASAAAAARRGEELVLADLHEARLHLHRLTGGLGLEDLYERVFSTFCIGK